MKAVSALTAVLLHAVAWSVRAGEVIEAGVFNPVVLQDSPSTGNTTTANSTVTASPTDVPSATSAPSVNGGGDDADLLIRDVIPEVTAAPTTSVALLADGAPWKFRLSAATSSHLVTGRELPAAATSVQCPSYAATSSKVLVAVSSCFSSTTYKRIEAWIKRMKDADIRYFPDDSRCVDFDVKWVDDGCNAPQWSNSQLKSSSGGDYIGVISIVVHQKAANTVAQFAGVRGIEIPLKLVYNGPNRISNQVSTLAGNLVSVQERIAGYTPALWEGFERGFLTANDLLGSLRSLHCADRPGSIAELLVSGGRRSCYCTCPYGFEFVGKECKRKQTEEDCTCAWSTNTLGYTLSGGGPTISNQCLITSTNTIPVPIAGDNYVDRNRINFDESSLQGTTPRVELTVKRVPVTVTGDVAPQPETASSVTYPFKWKEFQAGTAAISQKLQFAQYGKYSIELKAFDYSSNATCPGCVVVVDNYRPTHHSNSPCPVAPAYGESVSQLTSTVLQSYQVEMEKFVNFSKNAMNDPCGQNSQDLRCDDKSRRTKGFKDGDYSITPSASIADAEVFFVTKNVVDDLDSKLTGSAFTGVNGADINTCTSPLPSSVSSCVQNQCERCIDVSTTLKERYVKYQCGSDTATSCCEGTDSCTLKRCLVVNGSTLGSAQADIKPTVVSNSIAILKAKNENKNLTETDIITQYQVGTRVHIALPKLCTGFPPAGTADPNCVYTAAVSSLIDVTASALANSVLTKAMSEYVSWRYQVGTGSWKPLNANAAETFSVATTTIVVQAWTKCGMIKEFSFRVVLHPNTKIDVCDRFPTMWYQTTTPSKTPLDVGTSICMFPKSDFAEITFDYKPSIEISGGSFGVSVASVVCTMQYDGFTGPNATIVSVTKAPFDIIKEFSIDGARLVTTNAQTKVTVSCTFSYTRQLDASTENQICTRSFTMKDCTPPTITKPCPWDGKCNVTQCAKSTDATVLAKPDIYQACGGNRVTQDSTGNAQMWTAEATCCPSCAANSGFTTTCKPLRQTTAGATSDNSFIKRCEVDNTGVSTGGGYSSYPSYGGYGAYAVLEAAAADVKASASGTTSALLGATAMVAVVALVVARRRQAAPVAIEDDAYYPLMG